MSLGQIGAHPDELGVVPPKGAVEVALGYGDFLRGIEKLKALPLKERRQHMKNEAFRVSCVVTFFVVYLPTCDLTLVSLSELVTYRRVAG